MDHREAIAPRIAMRPRAALLRVLRALLNSGREIELMSQNGLHEATLKAEESECIARAFTALAPQRGALGAGRERGMSKPPRATTGNVPVHETIVAAVFNSRKGYGNPDACALYRIRHTTDDVAEAIAAAARAFMAMTGGVHPETPTRGPWQTPFTWGDALVHLPSAPHLLAAHGILDIAALDSTPDLVINHDDDLLAGSA